MVVLVALTVLFGVFPGVLVHFISLSPAASWP
jgi:hypothetical protein